MIRKEIITTHEDQDSSAIVRYEGKSNKSFWGKLFFWRNEGNKELRINDTIKLQEEITLLKERVIVADRAIVNLRQNSRLTNAILGGSLVLNLVGLAYINNEKHLLPNIFRIGAEQPNHSSDSKTLPKSNH
jgi:hypothetical protein